MTVVSEGILVHQLKRVSNPYPVADQCGGIKDRTHTLLLAIPVSELPVRLAEAFVMTLFSLSPYPGSFPFLP